MLGLSQSIKMDRTPPEIFEYILSYLDGPLASYAAVCHRFQMVIERKTFVKIRLYHTDASLREFDYILSDQRRRAAVRKLEFQIDIPRSHLEAAASNTTFTKAIHVLFTRLRSWADESASEFIGPLHLFIRSSCSEEVFGSGHCGRTILSASDSYIEFDGDPELPSLPFVTTYSESTCRQFHPSVKSTIWKALPRMRVSSWVQFKYPHGLDVSKFETRPSLISALAKPEFTHLEVIALYYDENHTLVNRSEPHHPCQPSSHDPLSRAVNRILKLPKIKRVQLTGSWVLSPEVFALDDGDTGGYGSLEELQLNLSAMMPDGKSYFDQFAHPAWDGTSWGKICCAYIPPVCPRSATMNPFLIAMARAVVSMPALRRAWCSWYRLQERHTLIEYWGPGQKRRPGEKHEELFAYYPSDEYLAHGRWLIRLGAYDERGRSVVENFRLSEELVQLLHSEGHRYFLARPNQHFHPSNPDPRFHPRSARLLAF